MKHTVKFFLLFLSLSTAFSFFGCANVAKRDVDRTELGHNAAVIFIPGYKGSRLKEKSSGETVWLTTSEILFGSRSLALEADSLGISNATDVYSDGLFKGFSIIPQLYTFSVYQSWSNFLKDNVPKSTRVIEFDYDWRADNTEHARRLGELIKSLKSEDIRKVYVLAHSMGGLILSYYLRYGGQNPETAVESWEGARTIDGALFAGTPFRGSVIIMNDLLKGNPASWNTDLLSREALCSFFSTFQLLPAVGDSRVVLADGSVSGIELLEWEQWKKNRWGFLVDEVSPETLRRRESHIQKRLQRAALLSQLINRDTASPSPTDGIQTKVRSVVGFGRQTLARSIFLPGSNPSLLFKSDEIEETLKGFNQGSLYDDGDGLVTVDSARLPKAYREVLTSETWVSGSEHGDFFDDELVRKRIIDFVTH